VQQRWTVVQILKSERVCAAQEYLDVTFLLGNNRHDLLEVNPTSFAGRTRFMPLSHRPSPSLQPAPARIDIVWTEKPVALKCRGKR
jgi:hypothetical protein